MALVTSLTSSSITPSLLFQPHWLAVTQIRKARPCLRSFTHCCFIFLKCYSPRISRLAPSTPSLHPNVTSSVKASLTTLFQTSSPVTLYSPLLFNPNTYPYLIQYIFCSFIFIIVCLPPHHTQRQRLLSVLFAVISPAPRDWHTDA